MNQYHWNKEKTIGVRVLNKSISVSYTSKPIITVELVYPHIIHAHLLTHRVFSRNTSSSRAVPANIDIPLHYPVFKQNQAGMSPGELFGTEKQKRLSVYWADAYRSAKTYKDILVANNVHKQWCNRLTEPYELKKVIVTATEWNNFFWLRDHKDAQDEICELARLIRIAVYIAPTTLLEQGEWHIPYMKPAKGRNDEKLYYLDYDGSDDKLYSTYEAVMLGASAVAQISYRKLDFSLEKAYRLWDIFSTDDPEERPHSSVFEHIAIPMSLEEKNIRVAQFNEMRSFAIDNLKLDHSRASEYANSCLYKNNLRLTNQLRDYM